MDLKINLLIAVISRHFGSLALFLTLLLLISPTAFSARETSTDRISDHVQSSANISSIKLLSTELQPSISIRNAKLNTYGTLPLCLFTKISSLSIWSSTLSVDSSLQLHQIKISNVNELSGPIELLRFSQYPDIKFIYILSEIDTSEPAIRGLLKNVPPNANVLFTIEKSSKSIA